MDFEMKVIFWCEFPKELDFKKLNNLMIFDTEVYFAVKNIKELNAIKKKMKNKNIKIGAWPVIDKKDGYWFSGFISKKDIDKLDEFKGLRVKIDIEPPIYKGKHYLIKDFFW